MSTIHQVCTRLSFDGFAAPEFHSQHFLVSRSISAKFSRKIAYVPNLTSLSSLLPMDHVCIPDRVKQ